MVRRVNLFVNANKCISLAFHHPKGVTSQRLVGTHIHADPPEEFGLEKRF